MAADPREFLLRLDEAAGLPSPAKVPAATPESLTYRVLAAIVASATKAVRRFDVGLGYVDSSGMLDGGESPDMQLFKPDRALLVPRPDDLFGKPGYRFWIVSYDHEPLMVVEQSTATAWNRKHRRLDLVEEYSQAQRQLGPVAGRALAFAFGRL